MGGLYTIGHSKHTQEYFVELLSRYKMNHVLDVRSTPYSKYAEQFNKDNVCKVLQSENIRYSFMGNFFGARPEEKNLYNVEGYLDFEKVAESDKFNRGIENVILGLGKKNNVVLMCTEKDPFDCHRAIMVARAFALKGIEAKHILANGNIQTQSELDSRLLDKYFPDRGQLSFFDNNALSDEEYLRQAYHERNVEIGYRLDEKVAI